MDTGRRGVKAPRTCPDDEPNGEPGDAEVAFLPTFRAEAIQVVRARGKTQAVIAHKPLGLLRAHPARGTCRQPAAAVASHSARTRRAIPNAQHTRTSLAGIR